MAANTFHDRLRSNLQSLFFRSRRTNARQIPKVDPRKLDFSQYCKNIMAQADKITLRAEKMAEAAKKAERMAQEAEKIAKKVAEDAEEFVRNKPRPGFHHPHNHFDNHNGRGPAPATTVYHHYHHERATATETSTATVTSTSVATSATTVTYTALITSTAAAASAPTAFVGSSARLKDLTAEEKMLEHVCSASFWVLGILLFIYCIALAGLLKHENPRDPKTKPSTEPNPHTSSLAQLDFHLTSLKPYITTPPRQILAVTICRVAAALCCLESYWVMKIMWSIFALTVEDVWKLGAPALCFVLTVIIPAQLFGCCGLAYAIFIVLDLAFSFASELALLPVSADASHAPTRKGKKRPKNNAFRGNKQADTDKQSTGSGSEEGWQTDLHG